MFRHLRDQIDRLLDRPPRTWESVVRRSQLFGDSPFPPERIILEVILQGRMQAVPHWNLHVAAVCGESMGAELVSTITLLAAEGRCLQEDLNAGLERWCFVCVLVPLESSNSGPDALVFEYMDSLDPWLPETLVQFQRIERPGRIPAMWPTMTFTMYCGSRRGIDWEQIAADYWNRRKAMGPCTRS